MTKDVSSTDRSYLMILKAGPVWNVDDLRSLAEAFGARNGEIVTWTGKAKSFRVDRMLVRGMPIGPDRVPLAFRKLWYCARVVLRGLRLRWWDRRSLTVITYDPFLSGLKGVILKWLTGATFICEINGVYGESDSLIDVPDRQAAERQRQSQMRVGSFVIGQAHGVKLLFKDQLVGFDVVRDRVPEAYFHDVINSDLFSVGQQSDRTKTVLFVGYPYLRKGVDILLKAFHEVAKDCPDWRLVLVGWNIEKPSRESGIPLDQVEFMGPQDQTVLRDIMAKSSILVLPSRSEGMGRVLLEAALLGVPRVGTRTGGIPHYIRDGIDGLIAPKEDVPALADALRQLMTDAERRQRFGDAGAEYARSEFTNDAYIRKYDQFLREVAAARSGRRLPNAEAQAATS